MHLACSIPDLQPGTYVLVTINSQGFIDEVWDNQACPGGCSTTDGLVGVPIAVSAGSTVSGRNFALDFGGRVSGTVTNAATNLPLQNVSVFLYLRTPSGATFARTGSTNAAGAYTVSGLPAGTYFAQTSNSQGFVNEIYDNVTCVGSCLTSTMLASGTPIPVTLGNTTAGRDFALETGGRVAGTIIDAATSSPVQNVGVSVYTRVGTTTVFANSTTTNAAGEYTVQGLAAGTYFAFTSNSVGYMNEIYDNIQCPVNCSSTVAVDSGAAIPVTLGGTTAGRNFALEMGGSITGVITSQDTGLLLQGIRVEVFRRIGTSNFFANSAMTDASGVYTVRGLPTASYWAYTSTSQNLINEIFDNVECRGACSQANAVSMGTPIPVTQGTSTGSRNFALRTGGAVSGTITDAITGLPLSGVGLEVWMQVGSSITFVGITSSDSSGLYTFRGLDAGNYVVDTLAHTDTVTRSDDIRALAGSARLHRPDRHTHPGRAGGHDLGPELRPAAGRNSRRHRHRRGYRSALPGVTVNIYQRTGSGLHRVVHDQPVRRVALRGVPNGSYVAYLRAASGISTRSSTTSGAPPTARRRRPW
jgi:5-hydroxyisourate hydrolase-like protein (transthyretin family)